MSPRFGYEGEKPRFCASHKEKQMVNLKDRRCARHPCTTQVRERRAIDSILLLCLLLLSDPKTQLQLGYMQCVTFQSQEMRYVDSWQPEQAALYAARFCECRSPRPALKTQRSQARMLHVFVRPGCWS